MINWIKKLFTKKYIVIIDFKSRDALDDLLIMTDAKDHIELIRKSLAMYDLIVHLKIGDRKLCIVKDNQIEGEILIK